MRPNSTTCDPNDASCVQEVSVQQEPRIPRIIHIIWLGCALPEIYHRLVESWYEHHPAWTVVFWTDHEAKYREHKHSKWEEKYGKRLQEETEKNNWLNSQKMEDLIEIYENFLKENGYNAVLEKARKDISNLDYDEKWKEHGTQKTLSLLSMSGCLPENIKTMDDYYKNNK